jgi:hypothetical protein
MPLLTQNERLNAALAEKARNASAHLAAAAHEVNGMAELMLSLDDAALTEWLNHRPAEETLQKFTRHGILGEAINAGLGVSKLELEESGLPAPSATVDVRSVPEKLAARGRVFSADNGVFLVTTPPPPAPPAEDPEPEPEPEPEP